MGSEHTLKLTNEFASNYDNYISDKKWTGPEMIFNLMKPYIKKGNQILDIGIGTGLASIAFKNYGLNIYGIDGSHEMIKICSDKQIADKLFLTDIGSENFELPEVVFDHVISNAVFHMIGNLEFIFNCVSAHLKNNGTFCFTTFPYIETEAANFYETEISGVFLKSGTDASPDVYRHSYFYVENKLRSEGLEIIESKQFIGYQDSNAKAEIVFEVFLAKK